MFFPFVLFFFFFSSVYLTGVKELQVIYYLGSVLLFFVVFTNRKLSFQGCEKIFLINSFLFLSYLIFNAIILDSVSLTIVFVVVIYSNVAMLCLYPVSSECKERYILKFSLCGFYLLILLSLLSVILFDGLQQKRFSSFLDNANTYTMYFILLSLINLFGYIKHQPEKISINIVTIVSVAFMVYFVLISGSRKSLIIACFVFIYYIVIFTINVNRVIASNFGAFFSSIFKLFIYISGLVVSVTSSVYILNSPYFKRMNELFQAVLSFDTKEGSMNERILMINKAFEIWSHNPVFGMGVDSFRYISGFGKYSHVNYLELLATTGILGFLLYYSFHFVIFLKGFSRKLAPKVRVFIYFSLFSLLFLDLTIVTYHNAVVVFVVYFLHVIVGSNKSGKENLLYYARS